MAVRKLVSGMFMSLDGVVQASDDWQFSYFDEELLAGIGEGMQGTDAAVMGRVSFAGYNALHVEHPDSPVLAFLERVDRYVASTTVTDTDWPGTTVLREDVYGHIAVLKDQPGGDILVAGSPTLVRGLLGRGLLDELNLFLLPIVVGSGDRLFPDESTGEDVTRLRLKLATSKTLRSGALKLQYVPDLGAGAGGGG